MSEKEEIRRKLAEVDELRARVKELERSPAYRMRPGSLRRFVTIYCIGFVFIYLVLLRDLPLEQGLILIVQYVIFGVVISLVVKWR